MTKQAKREGRGEGFGWRGILWGIGECEGGLAGACVGGVCGGEDGKGEEGEAGKRGGVEGEGARGGGGVRKECEVPTEDVALCLLRHLIVQIDRHKLRESTNL